MAEPADRYCASEPHGNGFRCPVCLSPHRLDTKGRVPMRHCSLATQRLNERLKGGPCRFEGAPTERVLCQTCSGKVEIKTFVCLCGDVPQPRAAWSEKQLPSDVAKCGPCDWYEASVPPEQAVAAIQERPPLAPDTDSPASEA